MIYFKKLSDPSWQLDKRRQPTGLSRLSAKLTAESLSDFRRRLKTHLFTKSYSWPLPGLDSVWPSSIVCITQATLKILEWLTDSGLSKHTLTVVLSEHLKTLKHPLARWTLTIDWSMAERTTAMLSIQSSRSRQRGRATTPAPPGVDQAAAVVVGTMGGGGETTSPRRATISPTVWRLGRRAAGVLKDGELLVDTGWPRGGQRALQRCSVNLSIK